MNKILLFLMISLLFLSPSFARDKDINFIVTGSASKNIIREINLIKPDLVFHTGTILNDPGEINTSLHVVPSNRDEDSEKTYYSFKHQGICFIVLNSEAFTHEQLDWLKKTINYHKRDRATFVFMHRALFSPPGSKTNETNFELIELLAENNISAIFSGNDNLYYRVDYKGTPFISIGGLANYAMVSIKGDKYKIDILEPFRLSVEQSYEEIENGKTIGTAKINNDHGDPLRSLIEFKGIKFRLPKGNYKVEAIPESSKHEIGLIEKALGLTKPNLIELLAPSIYKTEKAKNAPGMIDVWVKLNAPGTFPIKIKVEPK